MRSRCLGLFAASVSAGDGTTPIWEVLTSAGLVFLRNCFTQKTFSKISENITWAFTSLNAMASSFLVNKNKFGLQHTVQNADACIFPQ